MPVPVTRVTTWTENQNLTAANLNGEFNNIVTNMKPTSIESASVAGTFTTALQAMQESTDPGSVGSESLAPDLTGEIQRLRYVIKRIFNALFWYEAPVSIARSYVGPTGQQVSSGCGDFDYFANTTFTDVTNLSVTITTTGRPVFIGLIQDNSVSNDGVIVAGDNQSGTNSSVQMNFKILRGTDVVHFGSLGHRFFQANSMKRIELPCNLVRHIDVPAAGTYTYKLQINTAIGVANDTLGEVKYAKLIAYEIA